MYNKKHKSPSKRTINSCVLCNVINAGYLMWFTQVKTIIEDNNGIVPNYFKIFSYITDLK